MALATGTRLGPYVIAAPIGAGGMGEVYRARDTRLGRDVAIKILPAGFPPDSDYNRRFRREAQAIASLNHPHICVVHDVGQQDGINYLVMEYLEAQTLKQRLLENVPLPLNEGLKIASEIADALVEAHRHGIIHRDVKPGNIMLTNVGAKLLDFGLARRFEQVDSQSTDTVTSEGAVLGTPSYMSPEQVLGRRVDPRSDVFSLGVVMYEMVTGCRPFHGATVMETIDAVLHKRPEAISILNPDTPRELEQLITKCLEKEEGDRYQSVEDLWTDLTHVGQGTGARTWIHSRALRRHNLPLQLTSFIGRERELAELCSALGDTRLLTLSGSGGCGKTRLGLKFASTVIDQYANGVWLVEFGPVSNPELVPQCVASALGVHDEQQRPLLQRLVDYLQAKQLLLVLDSCEHLVSATAQFVEGVLTSCERVQILATSREPLRIPGERVWRVPSLSFPDSASVPLAQLSDYEAVHLFVERARCVSPFQLDQYNANRVVEICRRLDGLPLALEMAAARLDVLSVDQIAGRLNDRFDLLAGALRTSLPRQETLRATIDWSHGLLSLVEQILFRRLAVFAGGFTLEAVESICSDKDLRSEQMLEILSRLIDKSMVTVTRTSLGVRYHLLETLREYALEKFQNGPDERRTRNRHVEFFLSFAEQLEVEFESGHTALADDRAEQEHQNLLASLAWCNAARRRSQSALRIASALRPFWDLRCYLQLAKQSLLRALERDEPPTRKSIRIKTLDAAGYFLFRLDELDASRRAYEESLQLSSELGEQDRIGNALCWLGFIAEWQHRPAQAEALQRRSLEISRRHGFKMNMANALESLGSLAFDRGEHELAQSYWQESLDLFRQLGSKFGVTRLLWDQGMLATVRADYKRAESLYTEALALARESRHKGNVAFALIRLGGVHSSSDYQRSRALYEQALAIGREVGYKRIIAIALVQLAVISCEEGEYVEADRLLDESYGLLTQLHADRSRLATECLMRMSLVSFERGRLTTAMELCQRVMLSEAFESSKPIRENVLRWLGWIRLAEDDRAGARTAFEESLNLAQESERFVGLVGVHLGRGYCELLDGHADAAQSHFQAALSLSEQWSDNRLMVDALLALGDVSLLQDRLEQARVLFLRALRVASDLGFKKGLARGLRSVGILAFRQQRPELATRCFGAGTALLKAIDCNLPSFHSIDYESAVAAARSEIGVDQFQRLWDEGVTMSADTVDKLLLEYLEYAGVADRLDCHPPVDVQDRDARSAFFNGHGDTSLDRPRGYSDGRLMDPAPSRE